MEFRNFRFSAHRIVLAATIPYFRAMFTTDMAESQQEEIHLKGRFSLHESCYCIHT